MDHAGYHPLLFHPTTIGYVDVAQRVLLQSQLTGQLEASAEVQKATVPERLILRAVRRGAL